MHTNSEKLFFTKKNWNTLLYRFITSEITQNVILLIIVLNGVVLGLQTSERIINTYGSVLQNLDRIFIAVFVVELFITISVFKSRFFTNPWRVFDLLIIIISLTPSMGSLSILRSFRILRVLRVMSISPQMRSVVEALLSALPGMTSILSILAVLFYVFGVMSTKIFGVEFPEWFGSVSKSMYTLFQIMTLESWSMGIVRPVLEKFQLAWVFFIPFICITTFTMLNLFIAVMVNAMENYKRTQSIDTTENVDVIESIKSLQSQVVELKEIILSKSYKK